MVEPPKETSSITFDDGTGNTIITESLASVELVSVSVEQSLCTANEVVHEHIHTSL